MSTVEDIAVLKEGAVWPHDDFCSGIAYDVKIAQRLQSMSMQLWGKRYSMGTAFFFSKNIKKMYIKTRLKMLLFTINTMPLNRRKNDLIAFFLRLCRELEILDNGGSEKHLLLYPYDRFNPRPKLP